MEAANTQTEKNGVPKIKSQPIEKVSIIISKGSLDGVYPGLIMANGARMEGIEVTLFFAFFGLEAVIDKRMDDLKVATVANPAMHIPTIIGGLPGVSSMNTRKMKEEMEKPDIPPVREFVEMIHDSGAEMYACKAKVDMFHLKEDDFYKQADKVITVRDFYKKSAEAEIIFT